MSNNKQTAVEWLVQEINKINVSNEARIFINKLEQQAKAMHKEEIIDATCLNEYVNEDDREIGERYYNETFNNNE